MLGPAESVEIKHDITGEVVEVRERVNIEVTGEAPKFAGWRLVATLEHTPEGNLIRSVPTPKDVPALDLSDWRTAACKCDHCKLDRNRIDTHLVQHEDGSFKQVGANCIADFLGHQDPKRYVALADFWAGLSELCGLADEDGDEFYGGGRGVDRSVYVATWLAYCASAIRRNGYVSRKAQEQAEMVGQFRPSTKDDVMFAMFPPRNLTEKMRAKVLEARPEPQDEAYAVAAREWVLSTETDPKLSDFGHNLLVICKCEAIAFRDCGIAAYVVEAYRRHLEGEVKRAAAAARPNVHFGEVKKRYKGEAVRFNGCVTSFDTQFGMSYIYTFDHVATGARLKWMTSTQLGMEACDAVIDFTVKRHADWEGRKQTEVTRVKFITPALDSAE